MCHCCLRHNLLSPVVPLPRAREDSHAVVEVSENKCAARKGVNSLREYPNKKRPPPTGTRASTPAVPPRLAHHRASHSTDGALECDRLPR